MPLSVPVATPYLRVVLWLLSIPFSVPFILVNVSLALVSVIVRTTPSSVGARFFSTVVVALAIL